MLRIAVLISGRGSNLKAIQENIEAGKLDAEIEIVISNKEEAKGLEFAKESNIPTLVSKDESEIINKLKDMRIDLVCLAGYMKIISKDFIDTYARKIINIHPSLLPAFPGLNVQQKAIDYGVKYSGCTVHFVEYDVDSGPIILQAIVPIHENDTGDTLAARILVEEHKIYSEAIQLISAKKVEISGRIVKIK